MHFRRLGPWGLKLSEIGLGSWLTLQPGDDERAITLHRTAYERGINFFDTANAYAAGAAEVLVGQALKPFRRDTFVLATKLYWPLRDWPAPLAGANDRGLSRKHIFEQCHASLKRLDVEYIDLYQCHRYDAETPLIETCRAMSDLITQGKALYWGVSEWTADQIAEAVKIAGSEGWHPPVSNQPVYNMLERHWEKDVFPMCEKLGLGIVNFSPLAEGLLTGKYRAGLPPAPGTRAADPKAGAFITPRMTPGTLEKIARLAEVAAGLGVSLPVLALAWCLRRSEITSCIIGATRPQQVEENVKASGLKLDAATLKRVEAIVGT
jgi:aryl-alcohol dehydrogenase-like predicted oxidoreductase